MASFAAPSARLGGRKAARILTIIVAGALARSRLALFRETFRPDEIHIESLCFKDAQNLAAQDPRARVVESIEEAVKVANVVCLCTTSGMPVIEPGWLSPGTHVTSVCYFPQVVRCPEKQY